MDTKQRAVTLNKCGADCTTHAAANAKRSRSSWAGLAATRLGGPHRKTRFAAGSPGSATAAPGRIAGRVV
eukprot:10857457-Alexandrium_andersonii.AAC.1